MINVGYQLTMMANSRGGIRPFSLNKEMIHISVQSSSNYSVPSNSWSNTFVWASRFSCSSVGNHRELYEADPDDSAGSAGVKVTTAAAAPL